MSIFKKITKKVWRNLRDYLLHPAIPWPDYGYGPYFEVFGVFGNYKTVRAIGLTRIKPREHSKGYSRHLASKVYSRGGEIQTHAYCTFHLQQGNEQRSNTLPVPHVPNTDTTARANTDVSARHLTCTTVFSRDHPK